MKNTGYGFVGMLLLLFLFPNTSQATNTGPRTAGLAFAETLSPTVSLLDQTSSADLEAWKRRRRRKKKNTFAVGVVVGSPVGLGARAIFRIKNFGIAGDIAYNRIRSDGGPLVNALVTKVDARFYRRGLLGKLLRVYALGGVTMQHGFWDEVNYQTAIQINAGIGGGIKLWRISVNGEVGVLIPAVKPANYNPGFGAFANIGVMLWLF